MLARLCLLLTLLATSAFAQERPRAILVLDGSGSMWGQIDGKAKITIAQEVVGQLLGTLPPEQELGLTVYGHRNKGDCADIETIVAPGSGTREAIAAAVNGIKPKGKTPMTDAVVKAAEALRYTEEKATVILVSDGIETCEPDPCAIAKVLEETGVDFTAHVVGFDVRNEPEALAQMQCLAEETGGQFLTADNAQELAEALVVVAAEPPPPEPVEVRFRGIAGPGGPEIADPLVWTITGEAVLADGTQSPSVTLQLLPGDYSVEVLWPQYEEYVEMTASVSSDARVVTAVFPAPPPPPVKVDFYATDGANGPRTTDPLEWAIFDKDGAQLATLDEGYFSREMVRGEYRVTVRRAIDGASAEAAFGVGTVGKQVVLVLPEYRPGATIEAPAEAVAGSTLGVRWTGPDAQNDYIAVAVVGAQEGRQVNYTYTREGPLLDLMMPPLPGEYELRYVLSDGNKTLVRVPIRVVPVTATLEAPQSGTAGATIKVGWTGPDYQNDFIAVSEVGAQDGRQVNYTYTRDGNPLDLKLPVEPGEYELRYVMNQQQTVLVRVPISVTELATTLQAPSTVVAGAGLEVRWDGPDYQNDFIAISEAGAQEGRQVTYTYTRDGNPLVVTAPLTPGQYELRYVLSQGSKTATSQPLEVTEVSASLSAAAEAPAGSQLLVTWQGPNYQNDYVAVVRPGEDRKLNYSYTRDGSPLEVTLPIVPGDYELRYVAQGSPDTVLATVPVKAMAVTASVSSPGEAKIGQTLKIEWQGPDYQSDYIAIGRPGDRHETYSYTRDGSPLTIKAPETPGDYEIRYVARQADTVLATAPLKVSE